MCQNFNKKKEIVASSSGSFPDLEEGPTNTSEAVMGRAKLREEEEGSDDELDHLSRFFLMH